MKHNPSVIYMTRFKSPHCAVRTHDKYSVDIGYGVNGKDMWWFIGISRQQARMLAKRINQCLDASK